MNRLMIKCWVVRFLIPAFLLLLPITGFGQEILSMEQEQEIKLSNNYYFGECSDFEEVIAKECAVKSLTNNIIVGMVQQSGKKTEELLKGVEIRIKTAQLSMTGKVRILAWIEKDSVLVQKPQLSNQDTPQSLKPDTQQQVSQDPPQPVKPDSQQPASSDTPQPANPENQDAESPATADAPKPVIDSYAARELAVCNTFANFRRKANELKQMGYIIYHNNRNLFQNPNNCLIAVFTPEQKLAALLDRGDGPRTDLLTGKTVANAEQQYNDHVFYWINIIK